MSNNCLLTFTWDAPTSDDGDLVVQYKIKVGNILHVHPATTTPYSWEVIWPRGVKVHAEAWCSFVEVFKNGRRIAIEFETPDGPNVEGDKPINMTEVKPDETEMYNMVVRWKDFSDIWRDTGNSIYSYDLATWTGGTVRITSPDLTAPVVYSMTSDSEDSKSFELPEGIKIHVEFVHNYTYLGEAGTITGRPYDDTVGRQGVPSNFKVSIGGACAVNAVILEMTGFTPDEVMAPSAMPGGIVCTRVAGTNTYYGRGGAGSIDLSGTRYYGMFIANLSCDGGVYSGYVYLRVQVPGPPAQLYFIMAALIPPTGIVANTAVESNVVGALDWPGPNNGNPNNVKTNAWNLGQMTVRG